MSNEIKIKASIISGYQVINENGRHKWLSDEPEDLKGKDTAPTPMELLLSSLASCLLITLRMYSEHKKWDLGKIDVSLELIKKNGENQILKELNFENELSKEQLERLYKISEKCPVALILSSSIEIKFK